MHKKEWLKPTISILNQKILTGSSNPSLAEQAVYQTCASGICVITSSTTYSSVSGPPGINGTCTVVGAACS